MDDDVDMEAPQISTLREEATPPPASTKVRSRHAYIPWHKPSVWKGPNGPSLRIPKSMHSPVREDRDEPEEEEDQLIDDDDEAPQPSENVQNPKIPAKSKNRKGNKATGDMAGKSKEKVTDPLGAQNLAPTMSCFKATPAESHEDAEAASISPIKVANDATLVKAKKKVSPRKPPTIPRAKMKLAKYVYFSEALAFVVSH